MTEAFVSTNPLTSMVCQRAHFDEPWFTHWAERSGNPVSQDPDRKLHRKTWEWAVVAQALASRGMLVPGRRGCGFAVGREPMASLFASMGVDVLATDLGADGDTAAAWSASNQHAAGLDALHRPDLVDRPTFDAHVRFMPQDMRDLQPDALGTFDFIWSACSFEHLGSLEAGLQFVLKSTELLKPGGVAVHTTEINLSSLEETIATGGSVIYRQKDINELELRLRGIGCGLERPDYFGGTAIEDIEYDYEPYYEHGRHHIKLMLDRFVTTSMVLIIRKGRYPDHLPPLRDMALRDPVTQPVDSELVQLRKQVAMLNARLAVIEGSRPWRFATGLHRLKKRFGR
jgi:2-polyprenyl-3-methyl-5-hydroxy-6-metoxy-1,4-benzoquinol methylase